MPAYLVVEVTYHDLAWTESYRREVPRLVEAFGGRYVARSLTPKRLEGAGPAPNTLAILEFPDAQAAEAMLRCPEYQPFAAARQAGADTTIYLIP